MNITIFGASGCTGRHLVSQALERGYRVTAYVRRDVMLRVPLADHNANEKRIASSALQWTVVRPGMLNDGPQTGNLEHGSAKTVFKGNKPISRADVAAFMLDQVKDNQYINKAV